MHRLFALSLLISLLACARPVAKFTYTGQRDPAPAEVRFDNVSKNAESYEWDFGDGTTSTEAAPTHTYAESGNFLVRLKATKGNKTVMSEERIQINAPTRCLVEVSTEHGKMVVWLYDKTPQHRDNFTKLADEGFFNDLLFHRVIEGFMIQGGDPNSKGAAQGAPLGSGGPGYRIEAEITPELIHKKGALSAARQGDAVNPKKESSGSQFYIVQGRPVDEATLDQLEARKNIRYTPEQRATYQEVGGTPFLDADYTVFGEVIEGLDVIDKIAKVKTDGRDRPREDVEMRIRVIK